MIKLYKRPKPDILASSQNKWTTELMQYVYQGREIPDHIQGRYRNMEIKKEVIAETYGKCAYCESYVTHQYPGDIEHIIPKSVYPRLTFTWNNLSFVCYRCNNNKRARIDKTCKLLNPYKDEIGEHLRAFGPLILHINNSKRGELTHKEIKLNRKELCERRIDAINELRTLLDKYEREPEGALKDVLLREIEDSAANDKEFSCILHQFLNDNGTLQTN